MNKTHLVLVVAILGLAGFFLWSKNHEFEQTEREFQEARYFPNLEEKDVETIHVVSSEPAFEYELRRFGDQWFIDSHLVNVEKSYQLISSLLELSREREMDAAPTAQRVEEFQLDKPSYVVSVVANEGKKIASVKLGKRTPDFNHFYGQLESGGPISTVPAFTLGVLEDKPSVLRENSLFATEVAAVDRFAIGDTKTDNVVLVRKNEKEFYFEKPDLNKADESQVKDFLIHLKDLKVGRFLSPEEPVDLGDVTVEYVAQVSYSELEVVTELRQRVAINPKLVYGKRYLRAKDTKTAVEGTVERFVIEVSPQSKVWKPTANMFVDRRVLSFDLDDVKSVSLGASGANLAVSKDGMGKWVAQDGGDSKATDPAKINGFLWMLKDLRFEEQIADATQPTEFVTRVKIVDKSGAVLDLGFGLLKSGKPCLWRGSKAYSLSERSWDALSKETEKIMDASKTASPGSP